MTALARDGRATRALLCLGEIAGKRNDAAASLDWLERASVADPNDLTVKVKLGAALAALGRFHEAEAMLRSVLELAPDRVAALIGLGDIARRRPDLPEALDWYEKAIVADTRSIGARMGAASVLRQLSRDAEAVPLYRAVMEQAPSHLGCVMGLGEIATSRGERGEALSWFLKAAALAPRDLSIQAKVAGTLTVLGRLDEAEACYRAMLDQAPEDQKVLAGLGVIAMRRGNLAAALAQFEVAASAKPPQPWLELHIAGTLRELRRFDDAEFRYRSILEKWPETIEALIGLGVLERERKNWAAALVHFEAASGLSPAGSKAQFEVIAALRQLSRFDEAAILLDHAEAALGNGNMLLQEKKFENYCLTLQYEKAQECLAAWQEAGAVPAGAVAMAIRLNAALGHWDAAIDLFRTRVIEQDWSGRCEGLREPLVGAARATGRYRELCDLLDRLALKVPQASVQTTRDQIVEEMELLRLIYPNRPAADGIDTSIADPFRAKRAAFVANLLQQNAPTSQPVQIFTCADANYLIGAAVNVFSILRNDRDRSDNRIFTVYLEDEIVETGLAVFGEIGARFGVPIHVRKSSTLLPTGDDLRTSWGFSPQGMNSLEQPTIGSTPLAR